MIQISMKQGHCLVHSAISVENLLGKVGVRVVRRHGGLQLESSPTDEGSLLRSNGNVGRDGTDASTW